MADIPSLIQKLNDVEINSDEVLSEQLLTKVGGSINGLIDRTASLQQSFFEFNTTQTWVCPVGVNWIYIEGCGGGGGGGNITDQNNSGGRAGSFAWDFLRVQAGQAYSFTIGAGGAGRNKVGGTDGGIHNGGNTTISRAGVTLFFAAGGLGCGNGSTGYRGYGAGFVSPSKILKDIIGLVHIKIFKVSVNVP